MFEEIEKSVEGIVKKVVEEFEKKPIATTLKGIVVLYIVKKLVAWFRK